MYTVIDLIDKFIEIEKKGFQMYTDMSKDSKLKGSIKLAAGVFAREEQRHINIYKNLKEQITEKNNIEIEFDVYDKASKLASELSKSIKYSSINNTSDLLQFVIDFERKNLALALSIQGLLVRKKIDSQTGSYEALSIIIHEEKNHIMNLENFVR